MKTNPAIPDFDWKWSRPSLALLLLASLALPAFEAAAGTETAQRSGNYSDGTTWLSGNAPTNMGDGVIINGNFTVSLTNGEQVTSLDSISLGDTSGSGTLNVAGATTAMGLWNALNIGNGGQGTLSIDGARFDNFSYYGAPCAVGALAGGNNSLLRVSNGGMFANSGTFNVGGAATGKVLLNGGNFNNGAVSAGIVSIASSLDAGGSSLVVSNRGSFTNDFYGSLYVGNGGNGSMTVDRGMLANYGNEVVVGAAPGSQGLLVLSNGSTFINSAPLTLGTYGTGTMVVDGSVFTNAGTLRLGRNNDGYSTNDSAYGTLILTNGGVMYHVASSSIDLGTGNGFNSNSIVITGIGSTLDLGTNLLKLAGYLGTTNNFLRVEQGGVLTNGSLVLGNGITNFANFIEVNSGGKMYPMATNGKNALLIGGTRAACSNLVTVGTGGEVYISGINIANSFTSINLGNSQAAVGNGLVIQSDDPSRKAVVDCGGGKGIFKLGENATAAGNYVIVGRNGVLTNLGNNNLRIGASDGSSDNYVVVTNGGYLAVNNQGFAVYAGYSPGRNNGVRVTGTDASGNPSTLNPNGSGVVVGAYSTKSGSSNNWLVVEQGGQIVNGGTLYVGFCSNAFNNSALLRNGGLLEGKGVVIGKAGTVDVNNTFTNQGGVVQFTTATPNISIQAGQGWASFIDGTLAYRGVNGVNLAESWNPTNGVGKFTWLGTNSLRLDNATATNGLGASYVVSKLLGPTNFARVDMLNGNTGLSGSGLTVDSTGVLVLSNTTANLDGPLANAGTLTLSGGSVLVVSNDLALQSGGSLALSLRKGSSPANDSLGVTTGTLTYGGQLTVTTNGSLSSLAAGDSFTLFTGANQAGAFGSVNLPTLASGLKWDARGLDVRSANRGTIAVVPSAAVLPVITSVTPASGPASGGTLVTLTGTDFASGMTVRFGASAPVPVNFSNSTLVTVSAPAGSAGTVNVSMSNPDGQGYSFLNGFTYEEVATPPPAAKVTSVTRSGESLVLVSAGATNGQSVLWSASEVTLPLASWTPMATNTVGADGLFTNTVTITPGEPRRFYLLSIPY